MDALGLATSRSNVACSSVQELQGQLHQLIAAKTTETRAEHSSITFELLSHATFHLASDPENGVAEGIAPSQSPQLPITRTVTVSETVQNQPTDDPTLQKAVAKHISGAIGVVDSSTWNVREMTRGAQGWQFTYICRDSLQTWNRANAKNPDRPVIGSYSGGGSLDPINLSRPAFDCRGTLTIVFSKSSRGVIVKYEHTPLHKTVTQLVELLVPAPIPIPIGINGSQRTPKAKRPPPADGEEGSRKKRTPKQKPPPPVEAENGEESSRKRRTPKAKRPPPVEGENGEGSRKKRRKTGEAPEANMEGGLEIGQDAHQNQHQHHSAVDKTGSTGFLNVPPAEAERRRQTAVELLTGKGIEPATLSIEQFNIFANQAPNLQTASLEMLAKYGAERLRIVHPDEKEQAGSSNSTPTEEQTTDASPATTSAPLSGSATSPVKKPRSKMKKSDEPVTEVSIGNGAVVPLEQDGELGTTESALKPKSNRVRKTRGQCDTCRQRQIKCTKEHPNCSICIEAGVGCMYLPPKPRRKSEKSAEEMGQEDSNLPDEGDGVHHDTENEGQISVPDQLVSPAAVPAQPPPDMDNEEFIPDPNILSGPVEHQTAANQGVNASNYFQNSHSGIGFPQTSSAQTEAGNTSIPGLTYPQAQITENVAQPASSLAFPPASVQSQRLHGLPTSQSVSASTPDQSQQSVSSSSRKNLPSSQRKETPIPTPTIPVQASNWLPPPAINHATTTSPEIARQQAAKRSKSRKSKAESDQQRQDDPQQAASQSAQYQSPMTRSPYQSAAHVDLRQGYRSQTNTPVATSSRPPPKAPSTTTQQPTASAALYNAPATSKSISSYDPYPRYNNNGNEQYADTGDDHSSSRITYESSSYQTNATTTAPTSYSSTLSYDYGRAAGASNPLSQALNGATGYSGSTSSTTNQWPTSQTRAGQTSNDPSTYSLPATSTSGTRSYSTRASDSRPSNQNTSYNQPQSQGYSSYSSQQPSLNQQNQQNQWYGFTAANTSNQASYANNRQSGYDNHRSNAPAYSSQYTGNDEQAIYDLLRTGDSNH